jgi:hypothetical protein
MPLETIRRMIDSCQGLEDLRGLSMLRNYVSVNVRKEKATKMDQPQSNTKRADRPLQVVHFDLFGPCKHPSFAGHTYCVLIEDCTLYTWVYTIKNKSDVFDVLKKFNADTATIRCKHPLCCFRLTMRARISQHMQSNGWRQRYPNIFVDSARALAEW